MVCRYFGVVFVLFFMMISVNAEDNMSVTVTSSPVIAINSTKAAYMTTAPSSVIISTSTAPTSASIIRNTSSISPTSTSASPVIPATSPTPTPPPTTTASTKKPHPHEKPTKGRSFDSASFFGGIILGVIVAIASFVGYTYWQNKRKSYHSL